MLKMDDDFAEFSVQPKKNRGALSTILLFVAIIVGFFVIILINIMLPKSVTMLGAILIGLYLCVGIPLIVAEIKKEVEYDYLYVENDLEIAAVYNKSKRKPLLTIHVEHAKRIAPKGSQSILGYEGKGNIKIKDFTSKAEDVTPYVIVLEKEGKVVEVLVEPDEHLLKLMKLWNRDRFYEE